MSHIPLSGRIIGLAIEVHKTLGPGLLESAYEECLAYELKQSGVLYHRQVPLALKYKELTILESYKIDMLIENALVLELKSVETVHAIHEAQLLTYLRFAQNRSDS